MPAVFIVLQIIALAVFIAVVRCVAREYRKCRIEYENGRLLGLVIRFPTLVDETFYDESGKRKNADQTEFTRYNAYCLRVFNLLQELFYYGDGNEEKMRQMLDFDDYIIRHKKWWTVAVPRMSCYRMRFVAFVNRLVQRLEEDGELRKPREGIF